MLHLGIHSQEELPYKSRNLLYDVDFGVDLGKLSRTYAINSSNCFVASSPTTHCSVKRPNSNKVECMAWEKVFNITKFGFTKALRLDLHSVEIWY